MKITKQGLYPHLPKFIFKVIDYLSLKKIPAQIIFVFVDLFSTIWFLFRVIPKPSRTTYPFVKR